MTSSQNKFGKNRPSNLRFLLLPAAVALYFYLTADKRNDYNSKQFQLFYKSDLKGRVSDVFATHGFVKLKLKNNINQFTFVPQNLTDPHALFNYLAKIGDSIYKPAYSDNLILYKGDAVYIYTFDKHFFDRK